MALHFPNAGTARHAICEALHKQGLLNDAQITEAATKCGFQMVARTLRSLLDDYAVEVVVSTEPKMYGLCPGIKRMFVRADNLKNPPVNTIAPQRTPPIERPLRHSFIASAEGTREGSNDFRNWPSKHL